MNWSRFFRRGAADAEQREELEFHVAALAAEYAERGMSPAEAETEARRKLGNPALIREEVYRMNSVTFVENALRDLHHALRTLGTRPGFSVPALVSLALGIGANVAIFSVVNAVLIRPLPYPEPDALTSVYTSAVFPGRTFPNLRLSLDMFTAYEKSAQVFDKFGVWMEGAVTVTGLGEPEQIADVSMTDGVLPALGVRPLLGRWFSRDDGAPGVQAAVMLSYGYWQRRFAGDPNVLGRIVQIDFAPREVIGVMPRKFAFLDLAPEVFLPQRHPDGSFPTNEFSFGGLARLKPGVTLAQANQDIARVLKVWGGTSIEARQVTEQLHFGPSGRPLKQDVVGDAGSVLGILMGALVLVLLLVSANVANLVQVRAQARQQEFAIRAALGAGWARIARGLLVESLTLGVTGGAMGLALAAIGLRLLVSHGWTAIPRIGEISIDGTSLAFTAACSLGSSLLFAAIALYRLGRESKLENARGASAGVEQLRAQNALVVVQVGLALVLLIAAGLMIRSFAALHAVTAGFTHPERIQTVRLLIPETQIREPDRLAQMQADIVNRVAAIPGVTAAGFASGLPLESEYHNGNLVAVEGKTVPGQPPPNRTTKQISPGLFAALGTRLVAGRDFDWSDAFSAHRVAIVSAGMARANWGDPSNAPGKRIRIGQDGPWIPVVGVVEDVDEDGVDQPAPDIVYFPASTRRGITLAIRSERAGTESFLREIGVAIHGVNPSLPLADVRTLNDTYRLSIARTSFALVLLGIAGAMALLLAIVGVYGVLSYAVAQRRREVGIRVALGAEPGRVKALFVRQGLMLACLGGAIGLVAAGALSRWIASLLFGVRPLDPMTYGLAGAILVAAAMTATYIPARRAALEDPMQTLRSD